MTDQANPLEYVLNTLARLPTDPAELCDEEMAEVAVIARDSTQHLLELQTRQIGVVQRLAAGETSDEIADEIADLIGQADQLTTANEILQPYLVAAVDAKTNEESGLKT